MADSSPNNETGIGDEMIVHGETMIGEDGRLQSTAGKVVVTPELLDVILAQDVNEIRDPAASYVQSEDITRALLAQDTLAELPGPDDMPARKRARFKPMIQASDIGDDLTDEEMAHLAEAAANFGDDPRPFVGANPENKWMPEGLPNEGKDPMKLRKFIGDEFPRMLAYAPPVIKRELAKDPETGKIQPVLTVEKPGTPAYWSHWPEGTDPKDMNVIKVNIATELPEYMKKGTVAAAMKGRQNFSFEGQSLEDSFIEITEKVEKAWRRYAKDFEKEYGIRLDVRRDDSDDAHDEKDVNISVCGFQGGNPQLAGFASFPKDMTKWSNFAGLGHDQGYMMLNHEYCNSPGISEDQVYDLILHEMGHFFGWVHPHDLGAMEMSQAEALNSTAMAYTDGTFGKFEGQEGLTAGVVEQFFRYYMHNPPELNTEHGTVYDLEKQFAKSGGENWQSRVRAITKMIPAIPIINNGTGAKMIGTRNDDIIDTEPGHMSIVRTPTPNGSDDKDFNEQRFALIEGHIEKVFGLAGNNHIFASSQKSQEIHPGPGSNHVHIYGPELHDNKQIISEGPGRDTLVLHQDLFLANPDLEVEQDGNDIILKSDTGRIVITDQLKKGHGVDSIKVIDDNGRSVLEQDVSRFNKDDFKQGVIDSMKRHIRLIERELKELAESGEEPPHAETHEEHDHPHPEPRPQIHGLSPDIVAPETEGYRAHFSPQQESGESLDGRPSRLPRTFVDRVTRDAPEAEEKGTSTGRS